MAWAEVAGESSVPLSLHTDLLDCRQEKLQQCIGVRKIMLFCYDMKCLFSWVCVILKFSILD